MVGGDILFKPPLGMPPSLVYNLSRGVGKRDGIAEAFWFLV